MVKYFLEWLGFHIHEWEWGPERKTNIEVYRGSNYLRTDKQWTQDGTCKKCGMVKWRRV